DNTQQHSNSDQDSGYDQAPDTGQLAFDEQHQGTQHGSTGQHPGKVGSRGTQHGVERREVPDRSNVRRRLQCIGRAEVVELQEVAAHFRGKEHNRGKHNQEASHTQDVVHRVVGVEGDAIQRTTLSVFGALLDFDTVGVVGTHFVQRDQVSHNQAQQDQRHSNHVQSKEAVQGGVGHHVVTTDENSQVRTNERNGREQVNNHLGAPVGHLAPWQQVAHEGFSHQTEENGNAKDPDQFTWLAVRTVEQAAQHVQVHHHEEHGSACGVHVADDPATGHFTHDVFNRLKGQLGIRLVVHDQENTGHDLDNQHQQCQGAKEVPEVEVPR